MKPIHVEGKPVAKVMLYALSTCVWCKKTKHLMSELGVEYEYIDVDLLEDEDRNKVEAEIEKWNPVISFPTIVINESKSIKGYSPDEIKSQLKV